MEEKEIKKNRIFYGGPLFSVSERLFNKELAEKLRVKGYEVILPQDLGIVFKDNQEIDYKAIAERSKKEIEKCDVLLVNLDGPDTDSGTALEAGIAIGINKPVIGWRTDIRMVEYPLPWNGMFELCTEAIHVPGEFGKESIDELAKEINEAIKKVLG